MMATSARHGISCLLCISAYLTAISIYAIVGEVGGPSSLAREQTSLKRIRESAPLVARATPVKSFHRPQSLQEPDPNANAARIRGEAGLYFGTMADSMAGNGWETPWVQKSSAPSSI